MVTTLCSVGAFVLTSPMVPPVADPSAVSVSLQVQGPFDSRSLLDFLARRAVPGVERVVDTSYLRTIRLPGGPASLRLDVADARVEARFWLSDPADLETAVTRCRWLLDLDADMEAIGHHLRDDPHLGPSLVAHPGLRVPGHVDGFEVAVRAIVGQQISVPGARTVLARLVADYGSVLPAAEGLTAYFPTADALAAVDPASLPMPRSRGRALATVAQAVAAGDLVLDRTWETAEVRRYLLGVPGIGPWTADYIALRALGDADVFLGTDLGVRQGLRLLGIGSAGPEIVDRWSPWRSYALAHVWKALEQEVG